MIHIMTLYTQWKSSGMTIDVFWIQIESLLLIQTQVFEITKKPKNSLNYILEPETEK